MFYGVPTEFVPQLQALLAREEEAREVKDEAMQAYYDALAGGSPAEIDAAQRRSWGAADAYQAASRAFTDARCAAMAR